MTEPDRPLEGCTILIADDHPFVLETLVLMLEGAGATVVGVPNGQEALNCLRGGSFDLLITDIEMPGFDGLDLLGVIRRIPRWVDLPVVFFTSHADADRVVRAGRLGACAFLLKSSFDRSSLFARILEALGPRVAKQGTLSAAGVGLERPDGASESEEASHGRTAVEVGEEPEPTYKSLLEAIRHCNAAESDLRDVIECLGNDPRVSDEFSRFGNGTLASSGRAAAPSLRELVPRIGLTTTRIIIAGMLAKALAGRAGGSLAGKSPIDWDEFIVDCVDKKTGIEGRVRTFLDEGPSHLDRLGRVDSVAGSPASIRALAQAVHASATSIAATPLATAADTLARLAATGSADSLRNPSDRVSVELTAALATAAIVVHGLREAGA